MMGRRLRRWRGGDGARLEGTHGRLKCTPGGKRLVARLVTWKGMMEITSMKNQEER